jgi:phospholipid/cholesterol/gamma-HCH transport system substrate-binding protein
LKNSLFNFWVGLFVALGIGAIIFLAMKVGNLASWSDPAGYYLTARFDNIGNLKPRAPVKSAGVVVGRVDSIGLDPQTYEAAVKLKILPQYQFSKDTIAAIFTSGLLGEQFVGLEVGGDTVLLKDGETVRKTQSAVQLEKLISQFMFSKASEGSSTSASVPTAQPAPAVSGAPK